MKLRILIVSFFICIGHALWANGIEKDTISAVARLWKAIEADTLTPEIPKNYINWKDFDLRKKKKLNTIVQDSAKRKVLNDYIENLYLGNNEILNSLEQKYVHQDLSNDFSGYRGLKDFLSCIQEPSDACNLKMPSVISKIDQASNHSIYSSQSQWYWLSQFIKGSLPYEKIDDRIKISYLDAPLLNKSGSGAIVSFSRKTGTRNLLVSDNSKSPLRILEWNNAYQKWEDITSVSGLENFPGGNKYYITDLNNDKFDDIIILRKGVSSNNSFPLFPSVLKNNGDGTFKDITLFIGIDRIGEAIAFCSGDINKDVKLDLIFADNQGVISLIIQQEDASFLEFSNILQQKAVHSTIQNIELFDHNKDGNIDILTSTVDNKINILEQKLDSQTHQVNFIPIKGEHNIHLRLLEISDRFSDFSTFPKELNLMNSGVWVSTFDDAKLLFSGGANIEHLFPLFEYSAKGNSIKTVQGKEIPLYIHSIAVIEKKKQPYLLLKGGTDFFTPNQHLILLEYRPEKEGKYHRIFDLNKEQVGARIPYKIIDNQNVEHSRSVTVQPISSSGDYAMQEWIWLPEGFSLVGSSKTSSSKSFTSSSKTESKGDFQPSSSSPTNGSRDNGKFSPYQEKMQKSQEPLPVYPKKTRSHQQSNTPRSKKGN
ncbi:MAG: VCBS repeat-containing protein [Chitinophagales bacterium]|nr:VCBS repeat-containing protein [Chitinophagales bacterium]